MKATDLKQASFRGIPFAARAMSGSKGRRVVINEHPGKDEITHDDLGRARRTHKLEAVFTGLDWHERFLALLAACEIEGPGDMVHPDGWKKQVVLTDPPEYVISSVGEATVVLAVIEAPTIELPTSEPDSETIVGEASASLLSAAKQKFIEDFESSAAALESVTNTISDVADILNQFAPPEELKDLAASLHVLESTVVSLAQLPGELADSWTAVFDSLTDLSTLTKLTASMGAQAEGSYTVLQAALVTDTTPERLTDLRSIATHDYFVWMETLGSQAQSIADATWMAFDDAEDAVKSCSEMAITASDYTDDAATLDGLIDTRGALLESVMVLAQRLPRLFSYTPETTTSTAELAQFFYRDGSRGDEISERNGIQHPGFLPIASLLLLTE